MSDLLRLPVLDRLLESGGGETRTSPSATVEAVHRAVRRDLESLLNARRRRVPLPAHLAELGRSPLGYGIPDPTAGSFTEEAARQGLLREIERTIHLFEPRLEQISVSLSPLDRDAVDRSLRIRIEAVLRTDPLPEHVAFEMVVHAAALDVSVRDP